jgi:hypothetical protein
MVVSRAEGATPGRVTADGVPVDRSTRRMAAAKAAAAAGGLLSLSMVLLGQPLSMGPQPDGPHMTVRTAAIGTGTTAIGEHELPLRSSVWPA